MTVRYTNCKFYRQVMISVYLLATTLCFTCKCFANDSSRVSRKPANFVPDDDLIVVPMVIERNFIQDFHHKHDDEFKSARKKLHHWITQEQYAKDYGLENSGIVTLPTVEEKENFLQRHYLRFLSKDVERSTNKGLQNTLESWSADDEIDSITAFEQHEKVIVKARKAQGRETLRSSKSVKVGKSNMKFGMQVRPEIGMAKFTVKSKYFYARAWVGVNGNQELNVQKTFKSTGTTSFVNYYIDESRLLAAVDQKIVNHLSMRFTHSKDAEGFQNLIKSGVYEDNILQFRFNIGF